jgi:hypothetical protein
VTAAASGVERGSRRYLPWLAVVGALFLVALVVGAPGTGDQGARYDPASTDPSGTRALVLLLESFGAEVTVTGDVPDDADGDVALVLSDPYAPGSPREQGLLDWTRAGGTLVVADPVSELSSRVTTIGGALDTFGAAELSRGACNIPELVDLDEVKFSGGYLLYDVPAGQQGCFVAEDDPATAFVVARRLGRGTVVSLGSADVFVNASLDSADNAGLATALLLPTRDAHVVIIDPNYYDGSEGAGGGDRSLTDVLSIGTRMAFLELLVAFAVYAWFRARRLGRPVVEAQPVELAGSELVVAVGQLLQQSGSPDRAAAMLRSDLRRRLCERLGLPRDASPEVVADVAARRSGVDHERVFTVVADLPVTSDDDLLKLARSADQIRKEILDGPRS